MRVASYSWLAAVLIFVPMSEADLYWLNVPAHPKEGNHWYRLKSPSHIDRRVREDLRMEKSVWSFLGGPELRNMATELLRLLPKIPSMTMHPHTHTRMADITLSNLEIPIGDFKVRRVGNFHQDRREESLVLSFIVPKVHVTFSSDDSGRRMESRLPCRVVYKFDNITVDLKAHWSRGRQRTIDRASILNSEPGSIKSQSSIGNVTYPTVGVQRGSQIWMEVMDIARGYIPTNPEFSLLVTDFARRIFA